MYEYKGTIVSVYDADTCTVLLDLGFNTFRKERVRLYGIDTPELRTRNKKEKEAGYFARDFVRELILDKEVTIKTYKDKKGKFGRYLVEIILDNKKNLNKLLIKKSLAKEYFGGKKVLFKDWKKVK